MLAARARNKPLWGEQIGMTMQTPVEPRNESDRVVIHAISKRYGSITVLDNVSLSIKAGEVHGLLGANGAGKSTLCKILSGLTQPTAGQLFLDGKPIAVANKKDAELLGIEIVQQELNLIPTLTVGENLLLSKLPNTLGMLSRKKIFQQSKELLSKVGLDQLPTTRLVQHLGIGQQQLIEIAKSLRFDCKLLILDEPTASLSSNEAENLFRQIGELSRNGTSVVYISHRLEEVKTICDRVTILRDGRHVLTERASDLSVDEMVAWMSGDIEPVHKPTRTTHNPQELSALRVENISCGVVKNVNLEVKKGEILGITGLVGSGRTELLRAIFGADRIASGQIYLNNAPTPRRFSSPAQAVAAGIAMVTEDRKSTGLMLSRSVMDNAVLASLKRLFSRCGLFQRRSAQLAVERTCTELATKYEDLNQIVSKLSGGNQQKVVLAKWLLKGANVYLLDEPTKGIDVAARQLIWDVVRKLADHGTGILLVSSDIEEMLTLSDRIVVMSNGRLTAHFERYEFDKKRIAEASFAGHTSNKLRTIGTVRSDLS